MRLAQRVAIVTGAASGLGKEFSIKLAAEGASIAAVDINTSAETVRAITETGGTAINVITDISSQQVVQDMVAQVMDTFGQIDILINNAGLIVPVIAYHQITEQDWDRIMAVNVKGTWHCCTEVIPHMQQRGKGKIINISSATIWEGAPIGLHYVASKGAIWSMTRALARELSGSGINVNCVTPGLTLTEGAAKLLPSEALAQVRARQNKSRIVQRDEVPADVTGAVLFLASDDSDFISGQTINVDGGLSLA